MIIDHCRDEKEFYNLYNSIDNSNLHKAKDILNLKDFCFCFYDNNLVAVIYLEQKGSKIYLNGFSKRKNYKNNIDAVNTICNHFNIDIYAETPFKHAGLVLRRCGFKKIDNNLYKRSKKYGV